MNQSRLDMKEEQLKTGIRVCHRKTGNKYLVTSANMRMKDSKKERFYKMMEE